MKAYFIGGSHDLTIKNIEDDGERFIHLTKCCTFPVPPFGEPIPTMITVETEIYHKIRVPMSDGQLIFICLYHETKGMV